MSQASGRCLCGGLAFEAALPSKWVAHCHCSMCRRGSGAAFVTWVDASVQPLIPEMYRPETYLPWKIPGSSDLCGKCGWGVLREFWSHCPWCTVKL